MNLISRLGFGQKENNEENPRGEGGGGSSIVFMYLTRLIES